MYCKTLRPKGDKAVLVADICNVVFKCDLCYKVFLNGAYLDRHRLRRHHYDQRGTLITIEKPFNQKCEEKFQVLEVSLARKHLMETEHADRIDCLNDNEKDMTHNELGSIDQEGNKYLDNEFCKQRQQECPQFCGDRRMFQRNPPDDGVAGIMFQKDSHEDIISHNILETHNRNVTGRINKSLDDHSYSSSSTESFENSLSGSERSKIEEIHRELEKRLDFYGIGKSCKGVPVHTFETLHKLLDGKRKQMCKVECDYLVIWEKINDLADQKVQEAVNKTALV